MADDFGGGNALYLNEGPHFVDVAAELDKLLTTRDMGISPSILLDQESRVVDVFEGWSAKARKRIAAIMDAKRLP